MLTGYDSIFLNSDWAKLQHFRYALVYLFTFILNVQIQLQYLNGAKTCFYDRRFICPSFLVVGAAIMQQDIEAHDINYDALTMQHLPVQY